MQKGSCRPTPTPAPLGHHIMLIAILKSEQVYPIQTFVIVVTMKH